MSAALRWGVLPLFGAIAFLQMGCSDVPNYPLCAYQKISPEGWYQEQAVQIELDSVVQTAVYELSLLLRVERTFPLQKLWISVQAEDSSRVKQLPTDTVLCTITNAQGKPLGDGLTVFQYKYVVRTDTFRQGQTPRYQLRHLMQNTPLVGIRDVGIMVSKAQNPSRSKLQKKNW